MPFAPEFLHLPGMSSLSWEGRVVSLPLWITIAGLGFMAAMGRDRAV